MDVIIFADRKGQELLPLTDNTCVPLLPLAGKLIIEHTLEDLVDAGFRQAHIILSPFAEQVKQALGDGKRWGMAISYSTSRGEGSTLAELRRLKQLPNTPFLVMRGDVVRSRSLKDFLLQAETVDATVVPGLFNGANAYLLLCRDALDPVLDCLDWTTSSPAFAARHPIDLNGDIARLESLAAFHQANLDAAAGRIAGLLIPGRQASVGLTLGRNTTAAPQNLMQGGIALIGSNCHLHPTVALSGEVVIGDNVIIGSQATLQSTVVLPLSYIGELVDLRNAIVRGNDLIRIDTLAIVKISDTVLLDDLKNTGLLNKDLGNILNRLAGVLLLLLSLPLWLLAMLLAFLQNRGKMYSIQSLRGNKKLIDHSGVLQRTAFPAGEWQVKPPVLRYLPRLLAVISGDLLLVGSLPVSLATAEKRLDQWEKQADQAPAGLLGPTQLNLPIDASDEEKLLSDCVYAANYNCKTNAVYLLKSLRVLVSRKAWAG